jgi:putative transposase
MAFKLKVRNITKEDEKNLFGKYKKAFRKNLKQEDIKNAICLLFLDLIYLYFDNKKRKLYKLFFPVIMANFMELGSINSAIKEYRKKKKLFSESYTTRILRTLDEDDSLEVSRIFRKILFKLLKQNGFKDKGYCIAIDITAQPFYGNKNLLMIKGTKRKAGTNQAIQYLTASIVEEGVRFNLLCIPINALTSVPRKVQAMVSEIEKTVRIKILFLDRWFGNRGYCRVLKLFKYKFVMPITKNEKLQDLELQIKKQLRIRKNEYTISEFNYTFYENEPKEYQENVKLLALHEDNKIFFFITNISNFSGREYYYLIKSYRYRFGIETNYRVDNIFSAFTSSVVASVRYLLMQISLIAEDLWAFVNFLIADKKYQQPREKFKGKCSVLSIVKSRIKKLNFIWRPKITAVQFKRKMERILG